MLAPCTHPGHRVIYDIVLYNRVLYNRVIYAPGDSLPCRRCIEPQVMRNKKK
ncbi:hypothetical protein [Photorhabdus heterorhabditis]|uniref:hypothetical protein n=1 Tax=Photorhabdus heterorhabditis TaxID=880156 RepID=UPI00156246C5|nr:hypothetical protein [Photorhabdus heterorhabditis]NRN26718.1 hypothetical protein [Photorhabdus heterorhabditis subsp. aluminescens]